MAIGAAEVIVFQVKRKHRRRARAIRGDNRIGFGSEWHHEDGDLEKCRQGSSTCHLHTFRLIDYRSSRIQIFATGRTTSLAAPP
jgi:hypothetical protein